MTRSVEKRITEKHRHDPYPLFGKIARKWVRRYEKDQLLFGTLLTAPAYPSQIQQELSRLLKGLGGDFEAIVRVKISDQDRVRIRVRSSKKSLPILSKANAWSRSVLLRTGKRLGVIFYADTFLEKSTGNVACEADEHEVLHTVVDHITEHIRVLRLPFYAHVRHDTKSISLAPVAMSDHVQNLNPLLFPEFARIRRLERIIREGLAILLESSPVKMTSQEIQSYIAEKTTSTTVLDLLKEAEQYSESHFNSHTILPVRMRKEIYQHLTMAFLQQFAPGVPLYRLATHLNHVPVEAQKQFLVALLVQDPFEFLVSGYQTERQRHALYRDRLL